MTPEDIARDRAVLAAATEMPWEADHVNECVYGRPNPDPRSEGECDLVGRIAKRANRVAVAHAVNRLPAYIVEAEEMARRIAKIDGAATAAEDATTRHADMSEHAGTERERARASALRWALKTLRGES